MGLSSSVPASTPQLMNFQFAAICLTLPPIPLAFIHLIPCSNPPPRSSFPNHPNDSASAFFSSYPL